MEITNQLGRLGTPVLDPLAAFRLRGTHTEVQGPPGSGAKKALEWVYLRGKTTGVNFPRIHDISSGALKTVGSPAQL